MTACCIKDNRSISRKQDEAVSELVKADTVHPVASYRGKPPPIPPSNDFTNPKISASNWFSKSIVLGFHCYAYSIDWFSAIPVVMLTSGAEFKSSSAITMSPFCSFSAPAVILFIPLPARNRGLFYNSSVCCAWLIQAHSRNVC